MMTNVITTKGFMSECVVLSTSTYTLRENYTDFDETYILANSCTMAVDVVRAKELYLRASSFVSVSPQPRIDTSGANGTSLVHKTDPEIDKKDAYSISFSLFSFDTNEPLECLAKRGDESKGASKLATSATGRQ